jgi:hypothetical protein
MPGDVGLVAQFLNTVAEFFTDPTKWERLSREAKLATIREGLHAAIEANDLGALDKWMDLYRRMCQST